MHLVLTRASLAAWAATPVVTASEFWSLDSQLARAIDGDTGGTWGPTSVIEIGAEGLFLTGCVTFHPATNTTTFVDSGIVNVEADVVWTFEDDSTLVFELGAAANFENGAVLTIEQGADLSISGDLKLEATAEMTVKSGADVTMESGADVIFEGGSDLIANVGANVTINGDLELGATSETTIKSGASVELESGATFVQRGKLTKLGTGGRTRYRRSNLSADANHDLTVDADVYLYTQTNSTPRTMTLLIATSPQPEDGEIIKYRVINTGGGMCTVKNEGSAQHVIRALVSFTAEFIYDSSANLWRLIGCGIDGDPGATATSYVGFPVYNVDFGADA